METNRIALPLQIKTALAAPSALKHMCCPMELKALEKDGAFEGYASVFNNVDLGYDVVLPGAFKKKDMELTKDGSIRVLHQHRTAEPIGKAKVKEDENGLHFEGQLVLEDVPEARKAYALMKEGILDGMSIGYDVLEDEYTEGGIRRLKRVKLWEISVVTFGMNPKARIDDVKSVPKFATIREAEAWARDELGYSHEKARHFIAALKQALTGARDEPPRDEADQEAGAAVKRLTEFFLSAAKS